VSPAVIAALSFAARYDGGMSERKPFLGMPVLAGFIILSALMGLYLGGYFWLGDWDENYFNGEPAEWRRYRWEWLADAFEPAGQVETALRAKQIVITKIYTDEELKDYLDKQTSIP